ncbi:DUF350 domain-containing protein [Pseudonocardia xishanensis]|uniref:DUF350 domain-containing protein n=1 Tax=Pseudonocardia xishanensis TaxID=630995 RepID=A0ABP8RPW9_9PSEU
MTLALDAAYFAGLGRGVGAILLYALVGALLMLIGFWAIDITTPGKLVQLVREGKPGAVVVTSAGMVSMAFIVVVAIFTASGLLTEGLLASLVFGLVGIIAQVAAVRLLEWVSGIKIGPVLAAEELNAEAWVVAATHIALGLIIAVAII